MKGTDLSRMRMRIIRSDIINSVTKLRRTGHGREE